jgi:hypothetical protein
MPPKWSFLSKQKKFNKLHNVCQEIVVFVDGMRPSVSVRYLNTISKLCLLASSLQQPPILFFFLLIRRPPRSTHLSSTFCIKALFRPMFLCLSAFLFFLMIRRPPRSTHFQPGISFYLHHSFLCLGSQCHPTANAKPTDLSNVHQMFQHFKISWLTRQMNKSMTISSYTVIQKQK